MTIAILFDPDAPAGIAEARAAIAAVDVLHFAHRADIDRPR